MRLNNVSALYTALGVRAMRSSNLQELPPRPPGETGWPWTEETAPLAERLDDGTPWPDSKLEAEARDSLPGRMKAFGEAFISEVQEVLS
jgi:hypothetical protein